MRSERYFRNGLSRTVLTALFLGTVILIPQCETFYSGRRTLFKTWNPQISEKLSFSAIRVNPSTTTYAPTSPKIAFSSIRTTTKRTWTSPKSSTVANNNLENCTSTPKTRSALLRLTTKLNISRAPKSILSSSDTLVDQVSDIDKPQRQERPQRSPPASSVLIHNVVSNESNSDESDEKPNQQGRSGGLVLGFGFGFGLGVADGSTTNKSLNEESKCTPIVFTNPAYVRGSVQFLPIEENSKYLYPKTGFMVKPEDAREICNQLGLPVASVTNMNDFKHLVDDLVADKGMYHKTPAKVFSVLVEGSDQHVKGTYEFPDGQPLPFQMFHLRYFHYLEEAAHCLGIQCEKQSQRCYFKAKICGNTDLMHQEVMPLCEFPKDSACYNKSQTVGFERAEKDELLFVGQTRKGRFYGSRKQKTWSDAMTFCSENGGFSLLSFEKNDSGHNLDLYGPLLTYLKILDIPSFGGKSWTSGVFNNRSGPGNNFTFTSTGETWDWSDNTGHWNWADDKLLMDPEKELCMVLVDPGVIRPISCELPNYFLCWEPISSQSMCSESDGDICECNFADQAFSCQYNKATGKCESTKDACDDLSYPSGDCTRTYTYANQSHTFYAVAGQLCKSPESIDSTTHSKSCRGIKPVISVNLNGANQKDKMTFISYKSESELVGENEVKLLDPFKLRKPEELLPEKYIGNPEMMPLYQGYVTGENENLGTKVNGKCMGYTIPLRGDGDYELVIKTLEPLHPMSGKRSFNIIFNNVTIVAEVDLFELIGSVGKPIDFVLNFNVVQEGTVLALRGHPDTTITKKKVVLSFCFGQCTGSDAAFVVSAFSVVRFVEPEVSCKTAHSQDKDEDPCRKLKFPDNDDLCSREYAYYTLGGNVCKNSPKIVQTVSYAARKKRQVSDVDTEESGAKKCKIAKTIFAVNFGGEKHTDIMGITYQADKKLDYVDPHNMRKNATFPQKVKGVPEQDSILYQTYIWGSSDSTEDKGKCLTLKIPVGKEDGNYELKMSTVEFWHRMKNRRSFRVIFNDVVIFNSVDIVALAGSSGTGLDIYLNYEISQGGTKLILNGLKDTALEKKGMAPISFCFGDCKGYQDNIFAVSALSLVQFEKPPVKKNVTVVTNVTSTTNLTQLDPACGKDRTKICTKFHLHENQCPENETWYAFGGVTCKSRSDFLPSEETTKFCKKHRNIFGVNLNGKLVKSNSKGIEFLADKSVKFSDPKKIRKPVEHMSVIYNTNVDDVGLYDHYITTYTEKAEIGKCVSYTVIIDSEGIYQLTLYAMESVYNRVNQRSFTVRFNGIPVIKHVDIIELAGRHYLPVRIHIPFEVKDFRTLVLMGHNDTEIIDSRVEVSLCMGECPGSADKAFAMNALSVVRFGVREKPPIEVINVTVAPGDKDYTGECRENGCEEFKFERGECMRPDTNYAVGGQFCRKLVGGGNCETKNVIFAVNMNGPDFNASNGITYQSDAKVKCRDPYQIRKTSFAKAISGPLTDSMVKDIELYRTQIYGEINNYNPEKDKGKCLTYDVKLPSDGTYETSIRTVEPGKSNADIRAFNVRFHGLDVMKEVNIFPLAGAKHKPVDLLFTFRVEDNQNTLSLMGQSKKSLPKSGQVNLTFCMGTNPNATVSSFIVSAVHIIQLGGGDVRHAKIENSAENISEICRKRACERYTFSSDMCTRKDGWYTVSGRLCKTSEEEDEDLNCEIAEIVKAVNLNGPELTDSKGIKHEAGEGVSVSDLGNIIRKGEISKIQEDVVPTADEEIYKTFITGDEKIKNVENLCISFEIPLDKDGNYELALKFIETQMSKVGQRKFDVLFNRAIIIDDLDVVKVSGGKNIPIEILTSFKVTNETKILSLMGFSDTNLTDSRAELSFCMGHKKSFVVSAFSIVKFGDSESGMGSCAQPVFNDKKYVKAPIKFVRTDPNSRYLYPSKIFLTLPGPALEICGSIGLELATVNKLSEFRYIFENFIVKKNLVRKHAVKKGPPIFSVSLGANDTGQTGIYKDMITGLPIQFQMFQLDGSYYFEKGWDCLGIQCYFRVKTHSDKCYYKAKKCWDPNYEEMFDLLPLCQYPRGSECYNKSLEPFKNVEKALGIHVKDDVIKIGETNYRIYYGGTVQKTWDEALKFCKKGRNMRLLAFRKDLPEATAEITGILQAYRNILKLPDYAEFAWTSGRFGKQFESKESFSFDGSEETWKYSESKGHWKWIAEDLIFNRNKELCLLVINIGDDGDKIPRMRPILCNMINYFICYEEKIEATTARPNITTVDLAPPLEIFTPEDLEYSCETANSLCSEFDAASGSKSCIRENSLYAVGGVFCKKLSLNANSSCLVQKTILAVNMNGDKMTGTNGITYMAEKDIPVSDPHKIKRSWVSPGNVTGNVAEQDRPLYERQTYSVLKDYDPEKDGEKCVAYKLPVLTDGEFELNIKTFEPFDETKGRRAFNVRLGKVLVMKNVDISPLAGGRYMAVDLLVNFKIAEDGATLVLPGHPEISLGKGEPEPMELKFCLGSVRERKNFVLGAFHIIQFVDKLNPGNSSNSTNNNSTLLRPPPVQIVSYDGIYYDECKEEATSTPRPVVDSCPQPLLKGSKLTKIKTQFQRTGHNSKFLYPHKYFITWPEKALNICLELGLEPASVKTLADYKHIVQFVKEKQLQEKYGIEEKKLFSALLGPWDKKRGEFYKSFDSTKLLPYQLFYLSEYFYYEKGYDCHSMQWYGNISYFKPKMCGDLKGQDLHHYHHVMPLCQYPSTSDCYRNSSLFILEQEEVDELIFLTKSPNRNYYGGLKQKTWRESVEFCKSKELKLLAFKKEKANESIEITKAAISYRKKMDLPQFAILFWTAGRYKEMFGKSQPFTFESTGETWSFDDSRNHWEWILQKIINPSEEKCLMIVKVHENKTMIRPVICEMKSYFICYEDTNKDGDEQKPDCPEPKLTNKDHANSPVQFMRTSAKSKYLYPTVDLMTWPSKAKKICEELKLEPAEILSRYDYLDLVSSFIKLNKFMQVYKGKGKIFSVLIQSSIRKQNGTNIQFSGVTHFIFQLFRLDKSHYYDEGLDCTGLECKDGGCYFKIRKCADPEGMIHQEVMPLCQYIKDSECFRNSTQFIHAQNETDTLILLGEWRFRVYYGSNKQKTWSEALSFCKENDDMRLLAFRKEKLEEIETIQIVVEKYREKLEIPTFANFSWTSGYFKERYSHKSNVVFNSTGEEWSPEDTKEHWDWVKDEWVQDPESERCVMISTTRPSIIMRPVLCNMKNNFICYKDLPPNDTCVEPTLNNKKYTEEATTFSKTGTGSKYLYPAIPFHTTADESKEICKELNLESANIQTLMDYNHLVNDFLKSNGTFKKLSNGQEVFSIYLGGTDKAKTGVFLDIETNNSLSWQLFQLLDGNYYEKKFGCLSLQCTNKDLQCHFKPKVCGDSLGENVLPLCQFPREGECYKNSILYKEEQNQKDELIDLGETEIRIFYGSKLQKTWKEAIEFCKNNTMTLLSFVRDKPEESEALSGILEKYNKLLGLPPFAKYSWTSGYFTKSYGIREKISWSEQTDTWSYEQGSEHWKWIRNELVVNPKEEKCLMIVGAANNTKKVTVRPVVCDLKNYFICYEELAKVENVCETTELTFEDNECSKEGAFYSLSGGLCENKNSKENPKNCRVEETIIGINFNGKNHTDVAGITYVGQLYINYTVTSNLIIENATFSEKVEGVAEGDQTLYTTYIIVSTEEQLDENMCLSFNFTLPRGDGRYELALKMFGAEAAGQSFINAYLNGAHILREIDLYAYGGKGVPIEMLVNFLVIEGGRTLVLKGHPNLSIKGSVLLLALCLSTAKANINSNLQISALSVVKFSDEECKKEYFFGGDRAGKEKRTKFVPIEVQGSKYFFPVKLFMTTSERALEICDKMGLEPAMVQTIQDYWKLHRWMTMYQKRAGSISLAGTDREQKGVYRDPKTQEPLPLQLFRLQDDRYFEKKHDCLSLHCEGVNIVKSDCFFQMRECDERKRMVVPICQYERGSSCYLSTSLGQVETNERDDLVPLGATNFTVYYGGTKQKTWDDAVKFCSGRDNLKLLSLFKDQPDETKEIINIMESYRTELHLPKFALSVWTSGRFKADFGPTSPFKFESTGETWEVEEYNQHFAWVKDELVANKDEEKCVIFMKNETNQAAKLIKLIKSIKLVARPVVCDLVNYFICYEDTKTPPVGLSTTEETLTLATESTDEPLPDITESKTTEETIPISTESSTTGEPDVCSTFTMDDVDCTRPDVNYTVSGIVCTPSVNDDVAQETKANCEIKRNVLSVNLNGEMMKDSKGIIYYAGKDVTFSDPEKIRKPGKIPIKDISDGNISKHDKKLFTTFIVGNSGNPEEGKDKCISYPIPLKNDGKFELSLKFVESVYTSENERSFNVRLNKILILNEVDLVKVSGGKNIPTEVVTLFQVSGNLKNLSVNTHPATAMSKGKLDLAFCQGKLDDRDGNLTVSAFSVVEFGTPVVPPETPDVCDKIKFDKLECVRANGAYVGYGGVCKISEQMTNQKYCDTEKVIMAVNFNGDNHTSTDGIEYVGDKNITVVDINKIKKEFKYKETVTGVPDGDQDLYKTVIWGFSKNNSKEKCVTFKVQFPKDGKYELSLKTVEPFFQSPGKRTFNVFFNEIQILKEIDIVQHSGGKGNGIDFLVNFEVTGGVRSLITNGHPPSHITSSNKAVDLAFCMGTLNYTDESGFVISAISVIKFKADVCIEPYLHSPESKTQFIRTGPKSRYLYPSNVLKTSPERALQICDQLHMDPASIKNLADYKHLVEDFIELKNIRKTFGDSSGKVSLSLGVSDKGSPGEYFELKPKQPISFHMFHLGENQYMESGKDCLGLECDATIGCHYRSLSCKESSKNPIKVIPLCQYPKGSDCLKKIISEEPPIKDVDQLILIGEVDVDEMFSLDPVDEQRVKRSTLPTRRVIYGSTKQKNVSSALKFCKSNGNRKLLSFIKEKPSLTKSIAEVVSTYQKKMKLPSFANFIWTSGEFKGKYATGEPFTFQSTGEKWKFSDSELHWIWSKDALINDPSRERCMLMVANPNEKPVMRPVLCSLINYFICYEDTFTPSPPVTEPPPIKDDCTNLLATLDEKACSKPNSFHSFNGKMCKQFSEYTDPGNCEIKKTVIAVNFNGDKIMDTNGVTYQADKDVPHTDPDKIRKPTQIQNLQNEDGSIPENERPLYNKLVTGEVKQDENKEKRLTYKIPLDSQGDGNYVIGFKLAEPQFESAGVRIFTIRLNEATVVEKLDIIKEIGGKHIPMEILLNVELADEGKTVKIKGHPDIKIQCGYLDLSFCGSFAIGSFFVTQTGTPVPPTELPDVCPNLTFDEKNECNKEGHYAVSGGVCKYTEKKSKNPIACEIAQTVIAVNLNGNDNITDSGGIDFIADKHVSFDDKDKIRRPGTYNEDLPDISDDEERLYQTYVWGFSDDGQNKEKCLVYNLPVETDGKYQINLKMLEPWYNETGKRTFNVRLGGIVILKEIDIMAISGGKGVPLDILVNFELQNLGSALVLKGIPNTAVRESGLDLSFCMGLLSSSEDSGFVISAFSVVKFDEIDTVTEVQCAEPYIDRGKEKVKFIATGENSKYLYPEAPYFISGDKALEVCAKLQLEPPIIRTLDDYNHLIDAFVVSSNILENKQKTFSFILGATDKGNKGLYRELLSKKLIPFQLFSMAAKPYFEEKHDCLVVECSKLGCIFKSSTCKKENNVLPLCQYERESDCYKNASLVNLENTEKDELIFLSETVNRKYYGGTKQKTWNEASKFCKENNYSSVLALIKDKPEETQQLNEVITNYAAKLALPKFARFVWTSGRFKKNFNPLGSFIFEATNETWNAADIKQHFDWVKGGIVKKPTEEKCVLVIATDSTKLLMRPVICDLVNYFICYEDLAQVTESSTTVVDIDGSGEQEECPEALYESKQKIKYIRSKPGSKYFYPENFYVTTIEKGFEICESLKMVPAIIQTLVDYKHITDDLIKSNKLLANKADSQGTFSVLLGGGDKDETGIFRELKTNDPLPFQLFALANQHYYVENITCLALQCDRTGNCYFKVKACKSIALPLCQLPFTGDCYPNTTQALEETEQDDLIRLSDDPDWDRRKRDTNGVSRIYFGSTKQKTWSAALEFCSNRSKKLLTFLKDNPEEKVNLQKAIEKYMTELGLPSFAKFIWTSGQFKDGFGVGKTFTFQSNSEIWDYNDNNQHWDWISDSFIRNPSEESCMMIVNIHNSKFVIRPVLCELLSYFICYEETDVSELQSTTESFQSGNASTEASISVNDTDVNDFSVEDLTEDSFTEPPTLKSLVTTKSPFSATSLKPHSHRPHPPHCKSLSNSPCECQIAPNSCHFNPTTKRCQESSKVCSQLEKHRICPRPSAFYAVSGVLCGGSTGVAEGDEKCEIEVTVFAINFNGNAFVGSDGIKYEADCNVTRDDSHDLREGEIFRGDIMEIPAEDISLYKTFITGDKDKVGPGKCISYNIALEQDGKYEVWLKVVETLYNEEKKRLFNVYLDDIPVLQEVDIYGTTGNYKIGTNIVISFEVKGSSKILAVSGHMNTILKAPQTVQLKFCYGACPGDSIDQSFIVSAAAVVRLKSSKAIIVTATSPPKPRTSSVATTRRPAPKTVFTRSPKPVKTRPPKTVFTRSPKPVKTRPPKTVFTRSPKPVKTRPPKTVFTKSPKPVKTRHPKTVFTRPPKTVFTRSPKPVKTRPPKTIFTRPPKTIFTRSPKPVKTRHPKTIFTRSPKPAKTRPTKTLRPSRPTHRHTTTRRMHKTTRRKATKIPSTAMTKIPTARPPWSTSTAALPPVYITLPKPPPVYISLEFRNPTTSTTTVFPYFPKPKRINPRSPNKCSQYDGDICACRKSGCQFDLDSSNCFMENQVCEKLSFKQSECSQQNMLYAVGGNVCRNKNAGGNCKIVDTLYALNLNGGTMSDTRGVTFQGDVNVHYEDPDAVRQVGKIDDNDVLGVPKSERQIYSSFIWGSLSTDYGKERCTTYKIPLSSQDGFYELRIKTVQSSRYAAKGEKLFNVLFNGVAILLEVDLVAITNGYGTTADVIVNFEIKGGGKTLALKGLPETKILQGKVDLSFCFGECKVEAPGYLVSAFSIVRFENPPREGTDSIGRVIPTNQEPNSIAESKTTCAVYHGLPCHCRRAGCGYHVGSDRGTCMSSGAGEECPITETSCSWPNSFQVVGGLLCKNVFEHVTQRCHIAEVIMAVNLNGGPTVDSRGIAYKAEVDVLDFIEDVHGIRYHNEDDLPCKQIIGVPKEDKKIYETFIYGSTHLADSRQTACMTYLIPVKKDGNYQLLLNVMEPQFTKDGMRYFTVKINGQPVLKEIDIFKLAGERCRGIELVITFTLQNNGVTLGLSGYREIYLAAGKPMKLELCLGECGKQIQSTSFVLSSFAVVRLS